MSAINLAHHESWLVGKQITFYYAPDCRRCRAFFAAMRRHEPAVARVARKIDVKLLDAGALPPHVTALPTVEIIDHNQGIVRSYSGAQAMHWALRCC